MAGLILQHYPLHQPDQTEPFKGHYGQTLCCQCDARSMYRKTRGWLTGSPEVSALCPDQSINYFSPLRVLNVEIPANGNTYIRTTDT